MSATMPEPRTCLGRLLALAVLGVTLLSGCSTRSINRSLLTLQLTGSQGGSLALKRPGIHQAGYALAFASRIRPLLHQGRIDQAYRTYLQLYQLQPKNPPEEFLPNVEAGTLAVEAGSNGDALRYFSKAEHFLDSWSNRPIVWEKTEKGFKEILGIAVGLEDMADYVGEPYERILALNYKSLAYLLDGRREAYNVTRRAINWQNMEKRRFHKELEALKKRRAREAPLDSRGNAMLNSVFVKYDIARITSIPSAFVNPLGFYVAGMIQEFDSLKDRSVRDNARISYQKALELNPGNRAFKRLIRSTIKAMKRRPRRHRRLVHLLMADGFAPEKKVQTILLNAGYQSVPILLPRYEPVPSRVARIDLRSGRKKLATLVPVADVEAIVMRHQYDRLPFEQFKVGLVIVRRIFERSFLHNLQGSMGPYGQLLGASLLAMRESFTSVDTRNWMSLPKVVYGTRLELSKRLSTIELVSYDARGKVVARRKIKLPKGRHCFIYVRSIDQHLEPHVSKQLWI